MLGDLAVAHSHDVDGFKLDFSTGRRHTQECSLVCSMIRLISRHEISVGDLPVDICVEIRECSTKRVVKAPDAIFIRSGVWPGGMVNEVVSEELLEDIKVPTALHLFSIPGTTAFAASVDILSVDIRTPFPLISGLSGQ